MLADGFSNGIIPTASKLRHVVFMATQPLDLRAHVNGREDLGGVHPSRLLAGSLGEIGLGCISPALSRHIIISTGLAQWFHMDPDANSTIAGTRRSQVAWVILIYLNGFHMIHYPHENVQRSVEEYPSAQARDQK